MKFEITNNIFAKLPNMYVGVVVADQVDNSQEYPEIADLLDQSMQDAKDRFKDVNVKQDPQIVPYAKPSARLALTPIATRAPSRHYLSAYPRAKTCRTLTPWWTSTTRSR